MPTAYEITWAERWAKERKDSLAPIWKIDKRVVYYKNNKKR